MAGVMIIIGGLMQIAGVAVVVIDLRRTSARVLSYLHRDQRVDISPAYGEATALPPTAKVTPPPPVEERVRMLEEGLASLRGQVAELPTQIKSQMRAEMSEAVQRATANVGHQLRPLADLVVAELKADRSLRVTGVVLIIAGLALSTVGSLVAL